MADHQTAGRGRLGRTWTAPPGTGIAMSVLLRPEAPLERWTWLPLLAGLAVSDGIRQETDLPADLKWPNDVLLLGRKVCGVLAERVETPAGPAVVIGMGINVHLERRRAAGADRDLAGAGAGRARRRGRPGEPDEPGLDDAALAGADRLRRWEEVADRPSLGRTRWRSPTANGAPPSVARCASACPTARSSTASPATSTPPAGWCSRRPTAHASFGAGDVVHLR